MKGLVRSLPNEEYHSEEKHYSASRLKKVFKSMRHFKDNEQMGWKKYFDIGNAFELMLTDKKGYFKEVFVFNESLRPDKKHGMTAKANVAWKLSIEAENKGKIFLTKSDHELVKNMCEECLRNKIISQLVGKGEFQISVFWTDKFGLNVKTRPDIVFWLEDNECIIIDIKSCADASPKGFRISAEKLDYPFQAIMQIMGLESQGFKVADYFWLACEKDKRVPLAQLYKFGMAEQLTMKSAYNSVSRKVLKFEESGESKGYDEKSDNEYGILNINLSSYYLNEKNKF